MKKIASIPTLALVFALVAASTFATGALAGDLRLLPAQDGDLTASELVTVPVEKGLMPQTPREAVKFTFPLAADKAIDTAVTPFEARSLEYFVDVEADALRGGVELFTTAPEALVRLNPAAVAQARGLGKALALDPSSIVITAGDRTFEAGTGMRTLATAEQLKATGAPFADGTIAFRLAPEVGVGTVRLSVPSLANDGLYTLHVFDRGSDLALTLGADALDYLHGDLLKVRAGLPGAEIRTIEGFVTSPAGRAWPIEFQDGDDSFLAQLPLDALQAPGQGLWEAHVVVRGQAGDLAVMRSARTSFAAHLPTAGLAGGVSVVRDGNGLRLDFDVEVATAGRYEVRGVLFGTDRASGELRPMAATHAADWLDADGVLSLEVGTELIRESGLSAPFELRDLRLLDQGRMGVLHRQATGLRINVLK